jgi:hypothetical protein
MQPFRPRMRSDPHRLHRRPGNDTSNRVRRRQPQYVERRGTPAGVSSSHTAWLEQHQHGFVPSQDANRNPNRYRLDRGGSIADKVLLSLRLRFRSLFYSSVACF